ncbi:hypothetical protein GCM10011317_12190 [Niveispirillum cyanobacteriorum]|nr:hypothetical protein GCM10011317_12190 [Niveispirillum cyanobacteriorum]
MGERNGFTVAAPGQGGWLYDVTWLNYSGDFDARLLREIPLAVESEWNPDVTNLRVDFNKLLFSRANLCLFVCNDRPSVGGNARPLSFASQIELLLESVRAARNKDGFKMLVGCYMNAENRFQYVYLEGDEKVQILTNGRWMPWRWGRAVSG